MFMIEKLPEFDVVNAYVEPFIIVYAASVT